MPKLTSRELRKMQEESGNKLHLEKGESGGSVIVHMGTCGAAAGARTTAAAFLEEFEKRGIKDITLTSSGCAGFCSKEPMVTVELPGAPPVKYGDLNPEKAKKIVNEHIVAGKIVESRESTGAFLADFRKTIAHVVADDH
ncbi:MAG: hypothetical protein GY950_30925, partial [bacterium]|nr:hypothetical protein [bacterium]